jgi:hypothetical protein
MIFLIIKKIPILAVECRHFKLLKNTPNNTTNKICKLLFKTVKTLKITSKKREAGKWVSLCCIVEMESRSLYNVSVKFECNDRYHCTRKTILNGGDLLV